MIKLFRRTFSFIFILAMAAVIYFLIIQPRIESHNENNIKEVSLGSYTCDDLPTSFSSYDEAGELILNATYRYTDEVNTSKSSWIRSAWYLSCDGKKGFFCYTTDKQMYIHQNVPKSIWNEFKEAESFGRYYNYNIKGKYRLKLK